MLRAWSSNCPSQQSGRIRLRSGGGHSVAEDTACEGTGAPRRLKQPLGLLLAQDGKHLVRLDLVDGRLAQTRPKPLQRPSKLGDCGEGLFLPLHLCDVLFRNSLESHSRRHLARSLLAPLQECRVISGP